MVEAGRGLRNFSVFSTLVLNRYPPMRSCTGGSARKINMIAGRKTNGVSTIRLVKSCLHPSQPRSSFAKTWLLFKREAVVPCRVEVLVPHLKYATEVVVRKYI